MRRQSEQRARRPEQGGLRRGCVLSDQGLRGPSARKQSTATSAVRRARITMGVIMGGGGRCSCSTPHCENLGTNGSGGGDFQPECQPACNSLSLFRPCLASGPLRVK